MRKIHITNNDVLHGRRTFREYFESTICGFDKWRLVEVGRWQTRKLSRKTGIHMVPGAIVECISVGLNLDYQIIPAVSRATVVREYNVELVLEALHGPTAHHHLWIDDTCHYVLMPEGVFSGTTMTLDPSRYRVAA
jgi:hypothetical protein